jgi:hypothetical protein
VRRCGASDFSRPEIKSKHTDDVIDKNSCRENAPERSIADTLPRLVFDQRRAMFALFSGTVIERDHLARRCVLKTPIQGIRK